MRFRKYGPQMVLPAILLLQGWSPVPGQGPNGSGDTLQSGKPQDVDIDPKKLQDAISIIRHAVDDDEIPGAVVLIARQGRVIFHEAFGFRDPDKQTPFKPNSLFRMASNSKAVTAAGILLLAQQGRLDLDAPVGKYLPTFENESWRPVTLRHLLTHTSGSRIPSLFLRPLLEAPADSDAESWLCREVARFAEIPIEEKPGTTYSYNNAGYNILAAVIESLTGSYESHLKSQLYDPLGMVDSCNHESVADRDRMSTVMKRLEDGTWQPGWDPTDPPDWPFPRGSGGMVSSAVDYARFCQMLLQRGAYGGQQILDEAWVSEMTRPQVDSCPAAKTYGLGWFIREPNEVFSHTGSDGTFVWVDPERSLIGMVLTQCQATTIPRQAFRQLVEKACLGSMPANHSDEKPTNRNTSGFYKDIFMSSGKNLTSRKVLPAAESLGLTYEYYAGSDAARQNHLLIGNEADENGILLYPDGEPRFKMIYVNGGGATLHGKSLTRTGRNRLRQFNRSGGSYCGSCAGSFLSGRNVDQREERRLGYLHLFPYNTLNTGIKKTRLDHTIPIDSPLLRYRDFGFDQTVADVYHNNGNWLNMDGSMPDVEVLATYDHPEHRIDGGAAIWAFQAASDSGRIVNIGCHPEGAVTGEKLELTEACFLYGLDGIGTPGIKAILKAGETRRMDRKWSDEKPDNAKIGDLQYHHFALDVEEDLPWVTLSIQSAAAVDLHLILSQEPIAQRENGTHLNLRPGSTKQLTQKLSPGRWHASVYCATTVQTINDPEAGFHRYVGDRSILNGAPYQIEYRASVDSP